MSDNADDLPPELAGLSYEQARTELTEVVRALESGTASLEESLQLYKRGEDLATVCQRWLDNATIELDAAIAAHEGD